jgi:hypothetical protein
LTSADASLLAALNKSTSDLRSISRAVMLEYAQKLDQNLEQIHTGISVALGIQSASSSLDGSKSLEKNQKR